MIETALQPTRPAQVTNAAFNPIAEVHRRPEPLFLPRAMSFGKATVATRAPSTETYIQHGETGLLVEPRDVGGLRQAILHLWQNPDEAARMGQAARRRFEENHAIDKLAQRIYGVALEVLRAQRG